MCARGLFSRVALAALFAIAVPVRGAAAQPSCALAAADRAWIDGLLSAWDRVSREALRFDAGPLPWIVLFDESCVWHINAESTHAPAEAASDADLLSGGSALSIRRLAHAGAIRLPDGQNTPPRLTTFAATYGEQQKPFVVMAMPSLWRAEPRHGADPRLDALLRAVFAHEMAHTLQAGGIGRRLDALQRQFELPDDLDDNIVQKRFGDRPGFRDAYERERDLLYRASREPDAERRRLLVADAAAAMESRRARYFSGGDAVYAELEDLFLWMEGLGQWTAYRVAAAEGPGDAEALAFTRRDGKYWSQDEGLALFLVIDAMVPDWRSDVLEAPPASIPQWLADVAGP